jgi:6-phosphogluconolactonase
MNDFRLLADAAAVAAAAAEYLAARINQHVAEKGICHVVLPGGTTPARCMDLLAAMSMPWSDIHWYPGDERCYPVGHPERNDSMIRERLFTHPDHSAENFHTIPAEAGPENGAQRFADTLAPVGRFDLVVLGMGEDGHTASLFPGNPALEDSRPVVPVYDAPKPPPERISIGLGRLLDSHERIVLVTGAAKHDALVKVSKGEALPVARLHPDTWFADSAAAGELSG